MSLDKRRGYIRADQADAEAIDRWALPPYDERENLPRDTALNYDPSWEPEADVEPEESEPAPEPLTADALEAIRQQGYDEGYEEGKQLGHREGLDAGLEEGHEKGHEEGKKAGFEQGVAEGKALIEERCQHLDTILNQLSHPLEKLDLDVEQQLLIMVQALTKSLTGVELETNPQVILQTLRASIAALPVADHPVTAALHPDDYAIVSDAYDEEMLSSRDWTLQSEPALSRGDVHVKAKDSVVDYQYNERVDALLRDFQGQNQSRQSTSKGQSGPEPVDPGSHFTPSADDKKTSAEQLNTDEQGDNRSPSSTDDEESS
ncbi:flagellar assembly protein FliH [Salinivibrio sp. ES.052]|uniref:flagellar assembly protein FliH n=1 Tax=Salinivibrio sp. ES.052 TaxID=1882823 RepID=UPI00092631A8|nr:flagellar assembly protein FliH [Salinivibrio sp. ES.052]SIN75559.1 flagellar assembly protein FliH [Salinivibrio sp. ES.052]